MVTTNYRSVFAASVGGALEMYDFIVYAFMASIIAHLFFPSHDPMTGLIKTFGVFSIGYLARPIGGILFGHFGDKYGRKKTFIFTIIGMAIPTFLIGLLPTYDQIGVWATYLITAFRLLQGLAIGGDFPGGIAYIAENSNDQQRGLMCSWLYFSINIGILLASGLSLILTTNLNSTQMLAWGWRIPFLAGLLIALLGLYIRLKIAETPIFKQLETLGKTAKIPLQQLLSFHKGKILIGTGIAWLAGAIISVIFVFMPAYLTQQIGFKLSDALAFNTFNLLVFSCLIPVTGKLSDYIGRKTTLLIGAIGIVVFAYPLYMGLNHSSAIIYIPALLILGVLSAFIIGPVASTLAELFDSVVRYSGVALAYNLGFAVFGGFAPFITSILLKVTHNPQAPAFYLIFSAIVAIIAISFLKKDNVNIAT